MKKVIFTSILAVLVVCGVALSQYFPDVIVTGTTGTWVDTRAYATIDAAIAAIGASERDLYIVREEATVNLTIPANVHLHFLGVGSIANTNQLTINTVDISAGSKQIFTGTGDIDFAASSVLRTSWFSDAAEAFDITNDDELTLIVDNQETISEDCVIGNDVTLKWESSGNIITIANGFEISNIGQIEAGNYQILAGAGDFDFTDGIYLNLHWFVRLREILTWLETESVTIIVPGENAVTFSSVAIPTVSFDFESMQGSFNISTGSTVTMGNPANIIAAPDRQIFLGDGTVAFSDGDSGKCYSSWFGSVTKAEAAGALHYIISEDDSPTVDIDWDRDNTIIEFADDATVTAGATGMDGVFTLSGDNIQLICPRMAGPGTFVTSGGSYTTFESLVRVEGNNCKVLNGYFEDPEQIAVLFVLAVNGEASGNTIVGGPSASPAPDTAHFAFYIASCAKIHILNNRVFPDAGGGVPIQGVFLGANASLADPDGETSTQSRDCIIANNTFVLNWDHGIYDACGVRNKLIGNTLKSCVNGLVGASLDEDNPSIIADNHIYDSSGASSVAISLRDSNGAQVINNIIDSAYVGILVYRTLSAGTISDNLIAFNKLSNIGAVTYGYGIWFRYNGAGGNNATSMDRNVIEGNMINGVTGTTEGTGIRFTADAAVSAEHNKITRNIVRETEGLGIALSYVDDSEISYNEVHNSCQAVQNYAFFVDNSEQLLWIGNKALDDQGVATMGYAFGFSTVTDVTFKNNISRGHTIRPLSAIPTDSHGETISAYFGSVGAGTSDERALLCPGGENGIQILDVWFVNGANLAAHGTDYTQLNLRRETAGVPANIVTVNTLTTGDNMSFVAFQPEQISSYNAIDPGNSVISRASNASVTLYKTDGGAGAATDTMIVVLEYMTY